jgi:hypothetical protein
VEPVACRAVPTILRAKKSDYASVRRDHPPRESVKTKMIASMRSNRQLAGILMVVLGGLLLILSLAAVGVFTFSSATRWDFETATPLSMTVIASFAIVLVLLSVSFHSVWVLFAAACCSLFLLGQSSPFIDSYWAAAAGYWLPVASALVMSIGSVLLVADRLRRVAV